MTDVRIETPLTKLVGVRHPLVQTGMGWVAGPRLVSAAANAGALGILASATMTVGAAARGGPRGHVPYGRALRGQPAGGRGGRAASGCGCMMEEGVRVASFALAPSARADRPAEGRGRRRHPVRRRPAARREGRRLGRGRGRRAGRRGRRPHRERRHDRAASAGRGRGRHPGDRGGRLLRRPGPGRGARLRRGRRRHGHPLPADLGQHRAGGGAGPLSGGGRQGHHRHHARWTGCRTGCCARELVEALERSGRTRTALLRAVAPGRVVQEAVRAELARRWSATAWR